MGPAAAVSSVARRTCRRHCRPAQGHAGLGAPAVAAAPRARVRPGLERGRGPGLYSRGGPSPAPARPPPRLPAPGGRLEQGPSVPLPSRAVVKGPGASCCLCGVGRVGASPRGARSCCPPFSLLAGGRREGQAGSVTPAFSLGMTALTQMPWPQRLATPCLSLPLMYTWAFCAQKRARRRSEQLESSPGPLSCPLRLSWGSPDGTACLSCTCPSRHHPPGLAPACTPAWRTPHPHPVPLLNAPWVFSGPPASVQSRDGCVDLGSTGGWAFPAVGRDLGTSGGGRAGRTQVSRLGAGQVQRGHAQRVLSCRVSQVAGCSVSSGPLPLWLLLQEAAAWAAVSALGGGRVAAGRGLDQECVSRNVTALPTESGVGAGVGGWGSP